MNKKSIIKTVVISLSVIIVIALGVWLTTNVVNAVDKQHKDAERSKQIHEYYSNKLTTYQNENEENPDFEIIFLGDSLTDFCDVARYYDGYNASNRGIGGDKTGSLLDRLKVSAYDADPRVIVLLIGGNDLIGKTVDEICANYEKIITGIKTQLPETKIVWCSLTAMGDRWAQYNDKVIDVNERIYLLAQQYDCKFVDLFTPLYDRDGGEIFVGYAIDGAHLTDAGYTVVSSAIKPYLVELLGH